jgi:hypothetical protein
MKKKITGNDPTPRHFVESVLPRYYEVNEIITGIIRCVSTKDEGVEEESEWEVFKSLVKNYFGDSFREINHTTCTNHLNFTVYYDYRKLHNYKTLI